MPNWKNVYMFATTKHNPNKHFEAVANYDQKQDGWVGSAVLQEFN